MSAASIWEIAIKHALGRGDMRVGPDDAFREFAAAGFDQLSVTWERARRFGTLPERHKDPFDRLLLKRWKSR